MRQKLLHYALFFLLLLLTLYVYSNYTKLDRNLQSFHSFQNRIPDKIPSVIVFQSHRTEEAENCTSIFNAHDVKVHLRNKWQRVGTDSEWYIYSAYVDRRLENPVMRILAMSKGDTLGKLFCRTWYSTPMNSSISEIRKQELWIHSWDSATPGQYYHSSLLTCPIQSNSAAAVSIITKKCELPKNLINTTSPTVQEDLKDFVVCLKPLDLAEDISYRLLEWLELQFLLGADSIFVYVYNVHPQTWKLLKHYEKIGKLSIQIHSLPGSNTGNSTFSRKDLKTKNLWQKRRHEMVVYNDCFYRHIHSHRFVVNLDLDEAIIPIFHKSWSDLIKNASTENQSLLNSASLAVRNVYFFDSFGEVNDSSVPSYMHMLRHVYRSANFTPPGFAQKSFFATNLTMMVSNHFALQALRPKVRVLSAIASNLAHMHHYRKDCPPLMEKDCEDNYMKYRKEDTSLWRFKEELIRSVREKAKVIGLEADYA